MASLKNSALIVSNECFYYALQISVQLSAWNECFKSVFQFTSNEFFKRVFNWAFQMSASSEFIKRLLHIIALKYALQMGFK